MCSEREIQLTFKCHLWLVSIISATCITTNVLKSTRTLWPSIKSSKCHKVDKTEDTERYWFPPWVAAVSLIHVVLVSSRHPRHVLLSVTSPPAPAPRSWGLLWGWLHFQTYPLHSSQWNKFTISLLSVQGFRLVLKLLIVLTSFSCLNVYV